MISCVDAYNLDDLQPSAIHISPDSSCILLQTSRPSHIIFNQSPLLYPPESLISVPSDQECDKQENDKQDSNSPENYRQESLNQSDTAITDTSNAQPWGPLMELSEAEQIYASSWYPKMRSDDPSTCCFASATRDHPIRLWDAYLGMARSLVIY